MENQDTVVYIIDSQALVSNDFSLVIRNGTIHNWSMITFQDLHVTLLPVATCKLPLKLGPQVEVNQRV